MPMQCLCTMGASNRNFRWQRTKTYNIAYWLHKKTASWRGWTNFRQVPSSRLQNIVLDTRKKNHKVPGFPLKHRSNLASTNGCQASYQLSQPRFRAGPMGDSQLTDAGAKLQSTMEANRALNSVIWLFKIIACIVFFSSVFYFRFPVVSDLKSACCKRLHLCRMISKRPWKKRWTRCSRRRRQGEHSVLLLGLE